MNKKIIIALIIIAISVIIIIIAIPKGIGSGGISKEEFDKINIGLSRWSISGIIDPENTWHDEATYNKCVEQIGETYKDKKHTITYKYIGEHGGYAIIKFESDYGYSLIPDYKVSEKTQYDLK